MIVPFGSVMAPAAISATVPAFSTPACRSGRWSVSPPPISASVEVPGVVIVPSSVRSAASRNAKSPLEAKLPRSVMLLAAPSRSTDAALV